VNGPRQHGSQRSSGVATSDPDLVDEFGSLSHLDRELVDLPPPHADGRPAIEQVDSPTVGEVGKGIRVQAHDVDGTIAARVGRSRMLVRPRRPRVRDIDQIVADRCGGERGRQQPRGLTNTRG
jgi:hypothetical protein